MTASVFGASSLTFSSNSSCHLKRNHTHELSVLLIIIPLKSYISQSNNTHTFDFSLTLHYYSLPGRLLIFSKYILQKTPIYCQFNRFFGCDILKSRVEMMRIKKVFHLSEISATVTWIILGRSKIICNKSSSITKSNC